MDQFSFKPTKDGSLTIWFKISAFKTTMQIFRITVYMVLCWEGIVSGLTFCEKFYYEKITMVPNYTYNNFVFFCLHGYLADDAVTKIAQQ